jgi:hypothetical protein
MRRPPRVREEERLAAGTRAGEILLENGWQLGAGAGNPALIVAENDGRTLYGSSFAEIVRRAVTPDRRQFAPRTREGRARMAASASPSPAAASI